MRTALRTFVACVALAAPAFAGPVKLGVDVLAAQEFAPLRNKRVGVVTNQTGLDSDGVHLVQRLVGARLNVVKIFSPEHGLYGLRDEKVGDAVDEKTGLPVLSLYGKTRRPTKEMLDGLDVLVFDIQDVGVRFYTYISTMGLCMEEAAKHNVEFVVLDRPNPISGVRVEGPSADEKHLSFIAYRPIPLVHGMTVGELAAFFNAEYRIGARLTVVPMEGWRREMYWDDTGVRWVNPSPNMRSPTQALLYPAIGLLEGTNLSVGRGTPTPFEIFGAPFIRPDAFTAALNQLGLAGVTFAPVTFTPENKLHKHHKVECHGVRLTVTDRDQFDSALTGMAIAWTLAKQYPGDWERDKFVTRAHNAADVERLWTLSDPRQANAIYGESLAAFKAIRAKYLKY